MTDPARSDKYHKRVSLVVSLLALAYFLNMSTSSSSSSRRARRKAVPNLDAGNMIYCHMKRGDVVIPFQKMVAGITIERCTEKDKCARKDSRCLRWLRETKNNASVNESTMAGAGSVVQALLAETNAARLNNSNSSKDLYFHMVNFEQFVYTVVPHGVQHPMRVMLARLESCDADYEWPGFPPEYVAAYLRYYTAPETSAIAVPVGLGGAAARSVKCRGNTSNSAFKVVWAVDKAHRVYGIHSPCKDPLVVQAVDLLKQNKSPEQGAQPFDIIYYFPQIRDKLWNPTGDIATWHVTTRLMVWTMLIISTACIMRPSTISEYAPLIESIKVPEMMSQWDPDGYPMFLYLKIHMWKKKKTDRRPQLVRIYRNYVNPLFCPMLALLSWLNVCRLESGPLFRPISKKTKRSRTPRFNGTFITSKWFCDRMNVVFSAVGLPCTAYSIRVSAAAWYARCWHSDSLIRVCGRWSIYSIQFFRYTQWGRVRRDDYKNCPEGEDPAMKMWIATPCVTYEGTGSTHVGQLSQPVVLPSSSNTNSTNSTNSSSSSSSSTNRGTIRLRLHQGERQMRQSTRRQRVPRDVGGGYITTERV